MEIEYNDARPAYYPIISDLEGYMKKGVGAYVKWVCANQSGEDESFIPQEVVPIFDLKPKVRIRSLPLYTLPLQQRHLFFSHKSADIHVMEVRDEMEMVNVNVFTCKSVKTKIRYHRMSIYGSKDNAITPKYPIGSVVVVWNARCVHRLSFEETFTKLFNAYTPDVVIVTKARFDNSMQCHMTEQLNGVYEVDTFGTYNGYNGVLLIWAKEEVYPWVNHRGTHGYGHQLGVAIKQQTRQSYSNKQGNLHYPSNILFNDCEPLVPGRCPNEIILSSPLPKGTVSALVVWSPRISFRKRNVKLRNRIAPAVALFPSNPHNVSVRVLKITFPCI